MRQRLVSFKFGAASQVVRYQEHEDEWSLPRTFPIVVSPAPSLHAALDQIKPWVFKALGTQDTWVPENLMIKAVKLLRAHEAFSGVDLSASYSTPFESAAVVTTQLKLAIRSHMYPNDEFPLQIRRSLAVIDREAILYLNGWNSLNIKLKSPEVNLDIATETLLE